MSVTFINVGYGDSILFHTKDGHNYLLDGGSNLPSEFDDFEYRIRSVEYLKFIGVTHLDAVIISHIHEDHVCGLTPILKDILVDEFFIPYPAKDFLPGKDLKADPDANRSVPMYTQALNDFRNIISDAIGKGKKVSTIALGDELHLAGGLDIKVLGPNEKDIAVYMDLLLKAYISDDNNEITEILTRLDAKSDSTSLLLYIEFENTNYLMTADNVPSNWKNISDSLLEKVEVLKLPHHGQIDSINKKYMSKMPLEYVITTASSDKRYNSANAFVYDTLQDIVDTKVGFLFTDEREYKPYFSQLDGFNAIELNKKDALCVDFISVHQGKKN